MPHSPDLSAHQLGAFAKTGFNIDIEHCLHCGGSMKIIAAILEYSVITKILNYLGLPAQAPPDHPHKSLILSSPSDSGPSFSVLFLSS